MVLYSSACLWRCIFNRSLQGRTGGVIMETMAMNMIIMLVPNFILKVQSIQTLGIGITLVEIPMMTVGGITSIGTVIDRGHMQ